MNTTIKALAALITAALIAPAQAALISTTTVTDFIDFSNIQVTASANFTAPTASKGTSSYTESLYKDVRSYAQSGKDDFQTIKSADGKKNLVQQRYVDTTTSYTEAYMTFSNEIQQQSMSGTGSLSFSGQLQLNDKSKAVTDKIGSIYASVSGYTGGNYSADLYAKRTQRPAADLHVAVGGNSTDSQESHTKSINQWGSSASFNASAHAGSELKLAEATSFLGTVVGENFDNANTSFYVSGYFNQYLNYTSNDAKRWVTIAQTDAVAPVPEPETYALMGMGLVGLIAARRRKVKAA